MFKRANKITALLVAAASIMSVVPAMASERLGTKDGTINYGIAFDGGKYVYDGYRTDDDNTGIYYNGGDADKLIEDLEDYQLDENNNAGDNTAKFGSKYILATDNTDEYLVDLSTGKVVDNETDEEKRDTIQGKLRSTLKKTDRYANTEDWNDVSVGNRLFTDNKQFGDVWYMYSAEGDSTYTADTTSAAVEATVTVTLPTAGAIVDLAAGKTVTIGGETYTKTATATAVDNEFNDLAALVADVKADMNTWLTANVKTGTPATAVFAAPQDSANTITATATSDAIELTSSQISAINSKYGKYAAKNSTDATAVGQAIKYVGFVNEDGKYIDTSNLANIYAYSKEAEKVVKIEQYNDYDKDNEIMVTLDSIKPLAQDKDYIYVLTTATITQGTEVQAKNGNEARQAYFYQKIAKAQGDKKDDAYIPKTVDSFEVDNKKFYDNGDSQDAFKALVIDDDGFEVENNMYTVKDGSLYIIRVKEGKVKVFTTKTTKAKVDPMDEVVTAGDAEDKKLDAPLLQKTGDGDHDLFDGQAKGAVSLDVDGNLWALDKGSIYKVDGKTFNEVYTLDRSINNLDVYNDGSLIAWEDGGDVYTTVTEGKAVTGTEAAPATPAIVGWSQLADGTWNFYDATGAKVVNNWANVGGVWYYLKAEGVMATGWENVAGTWYYLAPSGAMKTGWVNDNGTWYYLASSGAMKTGWVNDNGTWYYLNGSGAMLANTTVDGYVLNASGAWVK